MKKLLKTMFDAGIAMQAPLLQRKAHRLVLLYHDLHDSAREAGVPPVNLGMSVAQGDFDQHLQWLTSFADLVSLDELLQADERTSNRWKVTITFDDAYRNVFRLALPILERRQIPATVFVPTWYIEDTSRLPWWDLADIAKYQWKGSLAFTFNATDYRFDMDQAEERQQFQLTLEKICYHSSRDQLLALQQLLAEVLSQQVPVSRNYLASVEELQAGARSPLITIASHGSCHYNAAQDSPEQFRDDVQTSVSLLESWTSQPVQYYSYPYGKGAFRSQQTADVLAAFDFKAAFSNDPGYLTVETDRMLIPRLSVLGHWDLRSFKSRVLAINMRNSLRGGDR